MKSTIMKKFKTKIHNSKHSRDYLLLFAFSLFFIGLLCLYYPETPPIMHGQPQYEINKVWGDWRFGNNTVVSITQIRDINSTPYQYIFLMIRNEASNYSWFQHSFTQLTYHYDNTTNRNYFITEEEINLPVVGITQEYYFIFHNNYKELEIISEECDCHLFLWKP